MSAFSVVSIIVLFLTVSLSGLTYLHVSRTKANLFFVLIGLASGFWILTNFLSNFFETPGSAIFWTQATIIGPAFLPTLLYGLVIELYLKKADSHVLHSKILSVYWSLSAGITLLSYTSLNVVTVNVENWGSDYVPGPLYYLLLVFLFLGFSWIFFLLFKTYRFSNEPYKSQAKYILIGTLITFCISTLASIIFPLFGYSKASLFGPPSMIFFVLFTGIAILKHKLFNIKLIAVESLSMGISLIFFVRLFLSSGADRILNILLFLFVVFVSILLVRGTLKDIKDRERVEQFSRDLIVANEQLRTMDRQKSDFVSIASHQLRTPLTAVKGYASLLMEGSFGPLPEKTMDAVSKIFESSQRMVMTIENFLTVSRIAQGRMYYKFESIDLQKIVKDMVGEMLSLASGYGITVRFYEEKGVAYTISADLMKVKQIVHNLLNESIEHTPNGLIDISLSHSQHGNHIMLAISDTGEGATQDHLRRMFEKYEPDMKEGEMRKETGVELYIVKEIAKAHQGKVWAESEGLGKGLTFFVELPVEQVSNAT